MLTSHRLVPISPRFAPRFLIRRVTTRSRKYSHDPPLPLPLQTRCWSRVCFYTHTHSHVRACTRLVLHRRPSYESLDALSRRWISRGTLLQQVHRGAALQSAAGADSAARRPCPRSCVLRNAESRRGIRFALWQTRRQRAVLCIVIDGGSSIRTRRIEQRFRDFSNIFLQSLQIRRRFYFESQGV